jgi:hypothetical protein
METKTASDALENIQRMADEMEERYENKLDLLQFQVDDACKMAERFLEEKEALKIDIKEHKDWRKVHYAIYFFLFVYGMVFGAYCRTKQQEL